MRNDTVELAFVDKTVIYSLKSLSLTNAVCNENLQHVETSAEITLVYDAELLSLLTTNAEIPAVIRDSEDAVLFSGSITTELSWTDTGRATEIDTFKLSIKDNTCRLRIKTTADILLEDTNLLAAVSELIMPCALILAPTLPLIPIPVFYVETGKTVLDILDALLYQYGFSFYFEPDGSIGFFGFRTIPDSVPLLGEEDMAADLQVSKTTKNYAGVSVSFNTLTTRTRELVYFEGNGYDSNDDPAPFVVQPGVYFPYEATPAYEELNGQQYQSFATSYAEARKKYNGEYEYGRNKEARLLYTKNHYVETEWTGSVIVDRTNFENTRASVRLYNAGGSDAHIYKLGIRADAVYRNASSTVTAGLVDSAVGNIFTTSFEFVYTMENAENTARALLAFFSNGNFKIKFSSEQPLAAGSFFLLNSGATGFAVKIFVYKCTLDAEKEQYSYECQTVSAATVTTAKSSVSFGSTGGAALAAVAKLKSSLNNGDGTYTPDSVTGVKAAAERDGISITWDALTTGLKNSVRQYLLQVSADGGTVWQDFTATDTACFYTFARTGTDADGYPEAADLLNYQFRIKAENIYGNQSEDWTEPIVPDVASYGTWQLDTPVITASVSHRSVLLRFSQPPRSDNRTRYGTTIHRVQIRKPAADESDTWFQPNATGDYSVSEANYKESGAINGSYSETSTDFSQTLPLTGQNADPCAPTYTDYQYRVVAQNESGAQSTAATVAVTARPTSVVDVVRGWEYNEDGEKVKVEGALGAENIYTPDLAAISANLGEITAGTLQSNIAAGETKPAVLLDLDGEEFRVGNAPSLEDADDTDAEYLHWIKGKGLFIKLKNFLLDALGAVIKGTLTIISATDDTRRTVLSHIGMEIEEKDSDTGLWTPTAKVTKDAYGNMIVSNDPDTLRPFNIKPPDGAVIYHLCEHTKDLNNGDPLLLDCGAAQSFSTLDTPFKMQGTMSGDAFFPVAESAVRNAFAPSAAHLTYTVSVTAYTNAADTAALVAADLDLQDIDNSAYSQIRAQWDIYSNCSATLSYVWLMDSPATADDWLYVKWNNLLTGAGFSVHDGIWWDNMQDRHHLYITASNAYPLTDYQCSVIQSFKSYSDGAATTAVQQAQSMLNTLPLVIATQQSAAQVAALTAEYEATGATVAAVVDIPLFYRHTIDALPAALQDEDAAALAAYLGYTDTTETTETTATDEETGEDVTTTETHTITAAEQVQVLFTETQVPFVLEDYAKTGVQTDYTGKMFMPLDGNGGCTVQTLHDTLETLVEEFVNIPQVYGTIVSSFKRFAMWFKGTLSVFGQNVFTSSTWSYAIVVINADENACIVYSHNIQTAECEESAVIALEPFWGDAAYARYVQIGATGRIAELYADLTAEPIDETLRRHIITRCVFDTKFTETDSYFILNVKDPSKVISNGFVTKYEWEQIATGTTSSTDPNDTSFAAQLASVQTQLPSFATKDALDATNAALQQTNESVNAALAMLEEEETARTAADAEHDATLAALEEAANKAHEHENSAQLDKFSENSDGELLYNGAKIASSGNVYSTEETECGTWIDGRAVYRKVVAADTNVGSSGIFALGAQAEIVISCTAFADGTKCIPCAAEPRGAYIAYKALQDDENITRFCIEYIPINADTPSVINGVWYTSRFAEANPVTETGGVLTLAADVAQIADDNLTVTY